MNTLDFSSSTACFMEGEEEKKLPSVVKYGEETSSDSLLASFGMQGEGREERGRGGGGRLSG